MKKKLILCGVCTIALILAAAVSVVSCSSDDEYYEGGNYTLANKRVTRSAPGDPAGSDTPNVGAGYVKAGYADGTLTMLNGKVNYNYRLQWPGGEIGDVKAYIIPTDGIENNSLELSYKDKKGNVVKMQEIASLSMIGLSNNIGIHNGCFYNPNIILIYKVAVRKAVDYGDGYIYEYMSRSAGPYTLSVKIPDGLIDKY